MKLDNPSTTMSWRTYRDWINSPPFFVGPGSDHQSIGPFSFLIRTTVKTDMYINY